MIATLSEVWARDLDVLHLVFADRHEIGVEREDVCGHQHRVRVQPDVDADIHVIRARRLVALDDGLVGVGLVHPALRGVAAEDPAELEDLRDVALTIDEGASRV